MFFFSERPDRQIWRNLFCVTQSGFIVAIFSLCQWPGSESRYSTTSSISIILEVLHCFPEPVCHPIDEAFVIYIFVYLFICLFAVYIDVSIFLFVCLFVSQSVFLFVDQCNLAVCLYISLMFCDSGCQITWEIMGTCHQLNWGGTVHLAGPAALAALGSMLYS